MSDRKKALEKIHVIPGMGCLVQPKGVAFRVWAPHAESVSVVGLFNDWDPTANPMQREEGDTWFALVDGAEEGQGYLYHIRNGEKEFTRPDPRGRVMENSVGNTLVWKPRPEEAGPAFTAPKMNDLVIYEMHVGSFHVPEGAAHGTFASAVEKMPYLKSLGINAIEVMPVAEFAGDLSWGYNPASPFAVESAYGGPQGLLAFVKAAHAHGIAVIMDVVYNHFGPSDLGLWQFDGWSENDKGGIYFYNDHRSSTPWGDTRPDYGRGEVRTYIRDNALMWFEEYGVDGLRWDMTVFIRSCQGNPGHPDDDLSEGWGLMHWVNDEIHAQYPDAITIAEDLRDSEWLVKGTGAGGAGFRTQWNAAFVHPVREVMTLTEDEHRRLEVIQSALTCCFDGDVFKRVIYSESHDEVANGKARLPSEISPDDAAARPARQRSNLAAALLYTAPGIPMIFQGQEFLTDEWFRDDVPLDWSRPEEFKGVLALYRDLAQLRRNFAGTTAGLTGQFVQVHHLEHDRKVLGYRRWLEGGPGDDVLVVLNLSHQAADDVRIGVPSPGLWKVRFHSDAHVYGHDLDGHPCVDATTMEGEWEGQPFSIHLAVGPYSAAILSQDKDAA
ncbi:alpha-amylase family glycosyl hydrolase [Prosthecobacter algae]|uniref:1,4-alpha-glucan branching enzyme n=1 Tax=Prosthecobacter algae TaxID=1144682 RepID=A0ABP9PA43_9BACT